MNILDTIVEQKRKEVAVLECRAASVDAIRAALGERGGLRDFRQALLAPRRPGPALIAEVKKASPSAGVIRKDFDPVRIATEYEAAGASCLSVLTDEKFFQGSLDFLRRIRAAVNLPLLRKDFIIDERQILEAAEWGADAILLIVAILTDEQLGKHLRLARESGLAVVVEVHDEAELDRAIKSGADIIGINNRNLKTFKVDLGTTERLALLLGREAGRLVVAESGIHTAEDVQRVARAGAKAILVGESLMRSGDLAAQIEKLLPGEPR